MGNEVQEGGDHAREELEREKETVERVVKGIGRQVRILTCLIDYTHVPWKLNIPLD